MADHGERYRVQSVDRAVDILQALADAVTSLTITELADRAGGSKSAIFATVQTLVARDLVRSTGLGHDRRYRLGLGLARLGELAVGQVPLRDLAVPVLRDLREQTGLTARASVWGGDCAVTIARVDGPSALRFDLHMGAREYLHSTSAGKAMLFGIGTEAARKVLLGIPLRSRTHNTLVTVDAVLLDIEQAADRGYAIDDEEDAEGIMCIGSPVRDHAGTVVGAISVTGIKALISADAAALGAKTRAAALVLSTGLGWHDSPAALFAPHER